MSAASFVEHATAFPDFLGLRLQLSCTAQCSAHVPVPVAVLMEVTPNPASMLRSLRAHAKRVYENPELLETSNGYRTDLKRQISMVQPKNLKSL